MSQIVKTLRNHRGISIISIILIITILLIIDGILIFIIIQNNNKENLEAISKNKDSSIVIVDVPEVEEEPLPNLINTTWKMSIFVEKLRGENIDEDKKKNIIDECDEDMGYVVFNEDNTITYNAPNNIINYEVNGNLITIDISQEGLSNSFEGSGLISLAYQNGMFISTNNPHLQYNNVEVVSRVKLENVSSDTIPDLNGTKWKITHDLDFNNLSPEEENEMKKNFELWDKNLISFDDKQYTLGEETNNYSIMGCILTLYFSDFEEMIYKDGKFTWKVYKTYLGGETVEGTITLTKVV